MLTPPGGWGCREALLEEEADIQAAIKKLSKSDPDRSSGDRIKIEAEVEELSERLGEIYARLADIDSDTAEVRASQILAGLQVSTGLSTALLHS